MYEGRLEICANRQWGTVCNDGLSGQAEFNINATRLVCRQLGIQGSGRLLDECVPCMHLLIIIMCTAYVVATRYHLTTVFSLYKYYSFIGCDNKRLLWRRQYGPAHSP